MFTSLRLINFKAWEDTSNVNLKRVTLFLGTNSSGKSTLIQSLLLLKQTVQSPDRSIHLNLGGDEINDLFNFGDFENVLRQGASSPRQFTLSFSFQSPASSRISRGDFSCSYGKNSVGAVVVQEWSVQTGNYQFKSIRRERDAYSVIVNDKLHKKGRHLSPERSVSLSAEVISMLGEEGAVLEDLSLSIRRELENIVYLGPLRRKPERDYVWNKSKPGEVGSDGHRAIDVLLASALMKGDDQNRIINGVSKWLLRMKVADKLEVKQLGRSTRYEVVIWRDGVEANLRDVGIGISQVLPVLTIAYFAPVGSTIILEEPEIHLHPLAQSVLAELFVDVSKERNIQFIVETHSEHLFRRMQTLIAKQQIRPQDTAMYFVERDGGNAKLRELVPNEFGAVDWPDKFFGDAIGEAREQAKARLLTRDVRPDDNE